MPSLLACLVRPRPKVDHLTFTVYSRKECCCCHTAMNLLERYRRRHRFAVEVVDVDSDPDLADRYGSTVPVVALDGKVRFKGVINPVLLERLLTAESRGR